MGTSAGCSPAIYVSGEQTVHAKLGNASVEDLTRMFNRQTEVEKDIQLSATLWDYSFIVAFQERRTTRKEQTAQVAKQNIEIWRRRFVLGQTAFRVRVELLNRGEVMAGRDRTLDLKQWSWKLKLSDDSATPYTNIHVELAKRFKAPSDRFHHRLDGVVHFPKRVNPAVHRWMELWAFPPGDRPPVKVRWNLKRP